MTYIVAVSGGVDSVVLLHKLVTEDKEKLIVAHFDHGIRPDSVADARFVEGLAKTYGLPFESRREELGPTASEALARTRRYEFLRELAKKNDGQVVTAHHADDMIETIAINLTRGTGWRGLAAMNDSRIVRPLLKLTKDEIYNYALNRQLEWVEDETNQTDAYLRNRLRARISARLSESTKRALLDLRARQCELRTAIETEERQLNISSPYSRYFFTHIDSAVGAELLRTLTDFALTRPQADRALHAIKVTKSGARIESGTGVVFVMRARDFIVETP